MALGGGVGGQCPAAEYHVEKRLQDRDAGGDDDGAALHTGFVVNDNWDGTTQDNFPTYLVQMTMSDVSSKVTTCQMGQASSMMKEYTYRRSRRLPALVNASSCK